MIMTSNSIVRPVTPAVFAATVLACAVLCGAAEEASRWVHPLCRPLPVDSNGPFVEMADGSLMTIGAQGVRVSQDDGKTWSEAQRVCEGLARLREGREPATFYIVRTRGGALVIVYLDSTTYNFSWDKCRFAPIGAAFGRRSPMTADCRGAPCSRARSSRPARRASC